MVRRLVKQLATTSSPVREPGRGRAGGPPLLGSSATGESPRVIWPAAWVRTVRMLKRSMTGKAHSSPVVNGRTSW